MREYILMAAYLVPLLIIWVVILGRRKNRSVENTRVWEKNEQAGLTEPASLHPIIDRSLCVGCGSCVDACPEGKILGLINDKAELINPTACIGHGACKTACPFDAIALVFGTSKRGVDIPTVDENFETNIPGLFIAGELGGMGLIRNAITQGAQAMQNIIRKTKRGGSGFDVVIIGAGPAGFSASLGAHAAKLRYATIEQESLGGTVAHFPRGKIVMTSPATLPIVGQVKLHKTTKEYLLEFWQTVAKKTGVKINYQERMESIQKNEHGFIVKTSKASYVTQNVLLAIGRRGTPRKLNVPGEETNKVVYRLIDAEQYRDQKVLVVGGGNSAVEAATSIAAEPGTIVTLSYRGKNFTRVKDENRQLMEKAYTEGKLKVILESNVKEIKPGSVIINKNDEDFEIPNDAVIISAGGVLPTPFLKQMGIIVETKHGTL